jgi:hypothetical protein
MGECASTFRLISRKALCSKRKQLLFSWLSVSLRDSKHLPRGRGHSAKWPHDKFQLVSIDRPPDAVARPGPYGSAALPRDLSHVYMAVGLLVGPSALNLFHFNPLKESALLAARRTQDFNNLTNLKPA